MCFRRQRHPSVLPQSVFIVPGFQNKRAFPSTGASARARNTLRVNRCSQQNVVTGSIGRKTRERPPTSAQFILLRSLGSVRCCDRNFVGGSERVEWFPVGVLRIASCFDGRSRRWRACVPAFRCMLLVFGSVFGNTAPGMMQHNKQWMHLQ